MEETDEVPTEEGGAALVRIPCLLVLAGNSAGRVHILHADETTLGRSQDMDILLTDAGVSRQHAKIIRSGVDGFKIVDLNSRNGTRLESRAVTDAQVHDGDTIRIGAAVLKFTLQHEMEAQLQSHLYEIASRSTLPQAARDELTDILRGHAAAAVGKLAAGIAHEINSPLGAILMCLEDAQQKVTTQPEAATAKVERAYNAALRAREIINKLLWYSREGVSERHAMNLSDMVRDVASFLQSAFVLEGIEVQCELGTVPAVLGNRHELQQVVVNLMQNARDAVLAGDVQDRRVQVTTRTSGRHVVLEVRDSGVGIAPDVLPRVFDPFFTTKPVGKGTGLGLTVSEHIARSHGGSLAVRSEPGGPTALTLTLPPLEA